MGKGLTISLGTLVLLSLLTMSHETPMSMMEPKLSSIDLHFASPAMDMTPGVPHEGEPTSIRARLALDGTQMWTRFGVVIDQGNPGEKDSHELNSPTVLFADGEYKMWYAGTTGVFPDTWILYANSTDGVTWNRHGAVLDFGPPGENKNVHFPFVMKEGSTYKMWYNGYDGSTYRIFYATSPNGLTWTRQGLVLDVGAPGSYDDYYVLRPFVMWEGSYKMWYGGFDGSTTRIMSAISSDGTSWTKTGLVLNPGPPGSLDDASVSGPMILKQGGGYHMWYNGNDGSHGRIFYAVSEDAMNWTRKGMVIDVGSPGDTDAASVYNPSVVHLPDKPCQMWYTGRSEATAIDRIHYAYMNCVTLPLAVETTFYLDSVSPAEKIGAAVVQVSASSVATAQINWTAGTAGNHTIYAVIDPSNHIAEWNELNNTASLRIVVLPSRPIPDAGGPYVSLEGSPIILDGSGSRDPFNRTLMYRWDFENDGTWDTPWSLDPHTSLLLGDDYNGTVALEVSNGNLSAIDTAGVLVKNVNPTSVITSATATGRLVLRVAGEKWHDVTAIIYLNGVEWARASVVRMPGSPDVQAVSIGNVTFNGLGSDNWSAKVIYTPLDDSINGELWGADPAWLIFESNHGQQNRIHHTFNVRHRETWTWDVANLGVLLVGMNIDFKGEASDPGSDDLTLKWSWGDSTPDNSIIYYNNGISPDPYPSPNVNPMAVIDEARHSFMVAGIYTVKLVVLDDDGGLAETVVNIRIG